MTLERMHVLGHPHLPLDVGACSGDAQVWTCRRFCELLAYLKIPYVYYGVRGSVLPGGGEFAPCRRLEKSYRMGGPRFTAYNASLSRQLQRHAGNGRELAASLYGAAQMDVSSPVPVIEPMVGYNHCWTHFRVFPSYAQQHVIYATWPNLTLRDREMDAVIPHFLNPDEFHVSGTPGDYLLYLGRDAQGKGVGIVRNLAAACKKKAIPVRIEHDGWSGRAKAELIANARAVLVPTQYVEPFGYIAAEALMSGTPVITTDWGAFVEYVEQGVDGFRCRSEEDFMRAVEAVRGLDRNAIRRRAVERFSLAAVAPRYERYFDFVLNNHAKKEYYAEKRRPDLFTHVNS